MDTCKQSEAAGSPSRKMQDVNCKMMFRLSLKKANPKLQKRGVWGMEIIGFFSNPGDRLLWAPTGQHK